MYLCLIFPLVGRSGVVGSLLSRPMFCRADPVELIVLSAILVELAVAFLRLGSVVSFGNSIECV